MGFYDEISKRRVREHCNENGLPSTFFFPAVTKKLRHVAGEKSLVNPYQKPQRLISRLLELFSNVDDWVLDLFSGTGTSCFLLIKIPTSSYTSSIIVDRSIIFERTGTTLACALKLFRNCISLEKDEAQVSFIKMRINGIWECPDADQEVGAKHVGDTERYQLASREPMPPLANEAGDLGELKDEPICDSTLHGAGEDQTEEHSNHVDDDDALDDEVEDLALL